MSKAARKPEADRVCAVCGANAGREGPLAYEWDAHPVELAKSTALMLSCSAACRAKAGLRERKGATCSS